MNKSASGRVAIVGVGESDIGKVRNMTGLGLNPQAAKRALDDAGLKVSDIDGVLTAYSFTEPYFMLGSVLCEYLGIKPRYNASMVVCLTTRPPPRSTLAPATAHRQASSD